MSTIDEIASRTATGMVAAFRAGEASPVEVTQRVLQRIEQFGRQEHLLSRHARTGVARSRGFYDAVP